MSEYQYYEFQAIDRPLSAEEMKELRSYSSRACITSTSFINDYAWGNFKGNIDVWMEKYFDAFLYVANWGTHILKLRLPSQLLNPILAREYCKGNSVTLYEKGGKVILSFQSDTEEGGNWVEGEGELASIISVRAELARGDLRALYLGWLQQVQTGELSDNDLEPPVPKGLSKLSASLQSLAAFLRIDHDLLHVAAGASQPLEDKELDPAELRAWVGKLTVTEKDQLITDFILQPGPTLGNELLQRFLKERSTHTATNLTGKRTVGELLEATRTYSEERKRLEAEQRAREKARSEQAGMSARQKYLDSLAGQETELWARVESLIATKQPKSYDEAVKILLDLRDLDTRSKSGTFKKRLEELRQLHTRKPSLGIEPI